MTVDSQLRPRLGVAVLTTSTLLASACGTSEPVSRTAAAAKRVARTSSTTPAVRFVSSPGLERALKELEKSYDGRIGAVAIDMGTGKAVGHRANERFPFNSM